MNSIATIVWLGMLIWGSASLFAQLASVPPEQRGSIEAERRGMHDAANIRTELWNFGMVGNYPADPISVDLSVFHSVEAPKGSGMNYSNGSTPFVLAKVKQRNGQDAYIMETGFRARQGISPLKNRVMRFEPRPGYFQENQNINRNRSLAVSSDPRTWPIFWPDKESDPNDPGWRGKWNGYFGKGAVADQESFFVMDDDFYDAWDFYPDSRDTTRRGLGLRIAVRGLQFAKAEAADVIFWHYEITNEGTTDYNDNIIFGMYFHPGVGGTSISCDGVVESDDDNTFFEKSMGFNLIYAWDKVGHGSSLFSNCDTTGYIGYSYLETPAKPNDNFDNDADGIIDERREGGPGVLLVGQEDIRTYVLAHYAISEFERAYALLDSLPAFKTGRWWTGDEDLDWIAELHDTGADGRFGTNDSGEGDGMPTPGELNFDQTDLDESDQIGLTGVKYNRIRPGPGNPNSEVDNIVFYDDGKEWPRRLYERFTNSDSNTRFEAAPALNYALAVLFVSGPFALPAGKTERFSLALAYGADLQELRAGATLAQQIHKEGYRPLLTKVAEAATEEYPREMVLLGNYPNPFNPSTTIRYAAPKSGFITLRVFDLLGKNVATLPLGLQTPGYHEIVFDSQALRSGIYFYSLQSADRKTKTVQATRAGKMLLLR